MQGTQQTFVFSPYPPQKQAADREKKSDGPKGDCKAPLFLFPPFFHQCRCTNTVMEQYQHSNTIHGKRGRSPRETIPLGAPTRSVRHARMLHGSVHRKSLWSVRLKKVAGLSSKPQRNSTSQQSWNQHYRPSCRTKQAGHTGWVWEKILKQEKVCIWLKIKDGPLAHARFSRTHA